MAAGRKFIQRMLDFHRGLVGLETDLQQDPNYYRALENVVPEPFRAHTVRPGTQRACSATLATEPHTLMEWVSDAGTAIKYAVTKAGVVYKMTGSAYTGQSVPVSLGANWLAWCQANGAIFATEIGSATEPIFYRASNTANTWLSSTFPTPGAMTLTNAVGGAVAAGTYYYRLRWRFTDGSSKAGSAQSVTVTNNRVAVTGIPSGSARTDYLGWTLERTAAGATSAGPFQWVADGTGTTYNDDFADADLGYVSTELIHGSIPNGHVEGMVFHAGRMFAWSESTLYASQAIGDDEATGICNWDARNAYDFGASDGTKIKDVIHQGNRLVILKDTSVWALEGSDLDSFTVVPLHRGAGAAGPRCAASMGATVWFFGKAGLHIMQGNKIEPFGWVEVGNLYRTSFADARIAEVVLRNHLSQRLILSFSLDGVRNGDMAVYDLRFNQWSRWTGIYAQDILVPQVSDFGGREAFLYADSRDRDPGAGTDYRPMIGFTGYLDDKAADGTGGSPITMTFLTPDVDGGWPDVTKAFSRLEAHARGTNVALAVTITLVPSGASHTLNLRAVTNAAKWGSLLWGSGAPWGSSPESVPMFKGLPLGLIGSRYRVQVVATDTTGDTSFRGLVVDGTVFPQRRLS